MLWLCFNFFQISLHDSVHKTRNTGVEGEICSFTESDVMFKPITERRERERETAEPMNTLPLTSIFTKLKSMWGPDRLMRPTVTNDGAIYRWREVQQNTTIIRDNGQCGVTICVRAKVKHVLKQEMREKRGLCAFLTLPAYFLVRHSGIAVHHRCETMTLFSTFSEKNTPQNWFINLLKSHDISPLVLSDCLLM